MSGFNESFIKLINTSAGYSVHVEDKGIHISGPAGDGATLSHEEAQTLADIILSAVDTFKKKLCPSCGEHLRQPIQEGSK